MRNSPNDFIAIATHYLANECRRGGVVPEWQSFEESLIKAAAVILAALERTDQLYSKKELR